MSIKEIRLSKGLSQSEAANLIGLSLRTYQNYEYRKKNRDTFKEEQIINILSSYEKYSETKGILTKKEIKDIVSSVVSNYEVNYVYLFGSYAKDEAKETSDVDLMINCNVKGLEYVGLADELRNKLHKRVDLIRFDDLKNDMQFINEIFISGEKIYG